MPSTQRDTSPLPQGQGQTFTMPGGQKDGKSQRLIVVSNRLPVTISKDKNGEYHFKVCIFTSHRHGQGEPARRSGLYRPNVPYAQSIWLLRLAKVMKGMRT